MLTASLELATRDLAQASFGTRRKIDGDAGIVAIKPSGVPYDALRVDDIPLRWHSTTERTSGAPPILCRRRIPSYRSRSRQRAAHAHSAYATRGVQKPDRVSARTAPAAVASDVASAGGRRCLCQSCRLKTSWRSAITCSFSLELDAVILNGESRPEDDDQRRPSRQEVAQRSSTPRGSCRTRIRAGCVDTRTHSHDSGDPGLALRIAPGGS